MADIDAIVTQIRAATKGFGTDEQKLINTIINLTPQQAGKVNTYYKANYGKPVTEVIEAECSGQFGKLLAKSCMPETYSAAVSINKAMKGLGTDEKRVIETLIGRSNAEIQSIKTFYKELYGKELEDAVRSEMGGDSKKFFTCILQSMRDEAGECHDVAGDVQLFYKAGEGKIGTDEAEFMRLLANRQFGHLKRVFAAYAEKHGRTMKKVVEKEFTGMAETTLVAMVRFVEDRGEYYAELINSSMAGVGTDESKLQRLVLRLRGTETMEEVKAAYLKKYGKTLRKAIESECSGDHEKMLVALVEQKPRAAYY
eukprot:Partr_v1_DN25056_c0_g1_i2_m50599 putative annexin A7